MVKRSLDLEAVIIERNFSVLGYNQNYLKNDFVADILQKVA